MHHPGIPIVAIPARNEESLLPRLLEALSRQTVLADLPQPLDIIVVLNNTDDQSGMVARQAVRGASKLRLTVLDVLFPPAQAHVGHARNLAMDLASGKIGDRPGTILTTDADAIPADTWIEANLRSIRSGADLVGGRIVGDRREEEMLGPEFLARAQLYATYGDLCDRLASLIDPLDHDPWPRHHDHTGASLAVRNDVYRRVGGLDPLPFREDLGFVAKVQAAGFRLCHPNDVSVTVSARTTGRAKGGMADCLTNWIREEQDGIPARVECPHALARRLDLRRRLRGLDGSPPDLIERKLAELGLQPDAAGRMPTIPQLIARHAAGDPDAAATVAAPVAIALLERMIAERWDMADAA